VTVLAREDAEVHLHALQTMTEQFHLCEWGHCHLGKLHHCSENRLNHVMHLITQSIHVFPCINSVLKGNNVTNKIVYQDMNTQCITEPLPCFTVGTDCRSP
jgi:hypothetical protein